MPETTYLDFDLLIERLEDGYTARVVNSPAGQASAEFTLPFSELELENFLLRIGRTRRGVRRLESPEMEAAKTFGGRLFNTVFGGEVRGCLRSSLDEAEWQGAGLRIRLRLTEAPELADLPWEYLYNLTLNRFLVLSTETPLVRYLELPERIRSLAVKPPLRILVMISNPTDSPPLDVEREWTKLREALSDLERQVLMVPERLSEATLIALQRRLRQGEYHIFHFIGHGDFDQQAQDGVLLLKDDKERGRRVSGQYLGTLLHDHRSLRLAILNACEGARSSRSDPFAGTAQSLVQQGIPAVIAMQFEVTDKAAITFAHEFYSALADGYPVDASLTEARKAIFAQSNDVEWGTPVLYLRSPDGYIFDIERVSDEERRLARIVTLHREAQTAMASGDWTAAIEKLKALLVLDPAHPDAPTMLRQAQQQQELATLYTRGLKRYEAGLWHEALAYFRRVQAIEDDYKSVAALIATIDKEIAKEQTVPGLRSVMSILGRWPVVSIPVALALLLFICGGAYLAFRGLIYRPTPTATPTQVITLPTSPVLTATSTIPTETAMPSTPTSTPETSYPTTKDIFVGQSVNSVSIHATLFGNGASHIVLVGGLHAGFAPCTVDLAKSTIQYFSSHLSQIPSTVTLHIIVNANPDSPHAPGDKSGRLNARGVDLNRNWDCNWQQRAVWRSQYVSGGSAPFSEPESQALRDYLLRVNPTAVVFWEAKMTGGLVTPGGCGSGSLVSEPLARTYGASAGYQVESFSSYALNGDATNWLDREGIPAISVLLPNYTGTDWSNNLKGILGVVHQYGN